MSITAAEQRRHVAVAEYVQLVMTAPPKYRYGVAFGILSGLVSSAIPDMSAEWALEFVTEINRTWTAPMRRANARGVEHV
jgi:hypothetical protein